MRQFLVLSFICLALVSIVDIAQAQTVDKAQSVISEQPAAPSSLPVEIIEEDDEDYYREYFPAGPSAVKKDASSGGNHTSSSTTGGHKLSAWAMYEQADAIVKAVMISLFAASVLAWVIWVYKLLSLVVVQMKVARDHKRLVESNSLGAGLETLGRSRSALAVMARSANDEISRSSDDQLGAEGIKERVRSHMRRIELAAGKSISSGTAILATIGSIAPFVGLFGTVWGIMNSFIAISETKTTNLAVVAPGIAEALLATAIGLVAAIPAVIFYNHLVGVIGKYRARVGDGAALVERMVSRDLDRVAFSATRSSSVQSQGYAAHGR